MRFALLLPALAIGLAASPAFAADTSSVDLVASFVLGMEDGSTAGGAGGPGTAAIKETAPGVFEGKPADGPAFVFEVTDKNECMFEIAFKVDGNFVGGIAVDAKKLKDVTYEQTAEHDGIFDYKISLVGAPDIVSLIDGKGGHSETNQDSTLSTSLTKDHMLESVAAFQSGFCPAAA